MKKKPHWTQTPEGREYMRQSASRRFKRHRPVITSLTDSPSEVEELFDELWKSFTVQQKAKAILAVRREGR